MQEQRRILIKMLYEGCEPAEIPAVLQAPHFSWVRQLGVCTSGASVEKMEAIAFLCLRGHSSPHLSSFPADDFSARSSFWQKSHISVTGYCTNSTVISMARLSVHLHKNEMGTPSTQDKKPRFPLSICSSALKLAYIHPFLLHRKRLIDNLEAKQKSYSSPLY